MDFKVGDRVEIVGLFSRLSMGSRGQVYSFVRNDVGVWWDDFTDGHSGNGSRGKVHSGWVVDSTDLRLLAEEPLLIELPVIRRKLCIEGTSGDGDQAVQYSCEFDDGHSYHYAKEGGNG